LIKSACKCKKLFYCILAYGQGAG